MKEELIRFLEALAAVKGLRDQHGTSFECFGSCSSLACHQTGLHRDNPVCRVCEKMYFDGSGEWVREETAKLGR